MTGRDTTSRPPRLTASPALDAVPPYPFAELERQAERLRTDGQEVLNFGIGDPDLPPPAWLVESAQREIAAPRASRYSTSRGEPEFREAIAAWMQGRFGVRADMDREIAVLIGSKEGLASMPRALCRPGDTVGVPDPGYPAYRAAVRLALAEPALLPLRAEQGYRPDWDRLRGGTRLVYLNYPNNPTGRVASLSDLAEAVDRARDGGFLIAYDNAYSEVTFGSHPAPSILEVPGGAEVAVEFHSLSKTFGVAGWRLGFAVGNADALDLLVKLKSQSDSGACTPLQRAAATALARYRGRDPPVEVARSVAEYGRRLRSLSDGLTKLDMRAPMPEGGLYLWQEVGDEGGERFAARLLGSSGIAVTPGSGFGGSGKGYVRWAATRPMVEVERALARLATGPRMVETTIGTGRSSPATFGDRSAAGPAAALDPSP